MVVSGGCGAAASEIKGPHQATGQEPWTPRPTLRCYFCWARRSQVLMQLRRVSPHKLEEDKEACMLLSNPHSCRHSNLVAGTGLLLPGYPEAPAAELRIQTRTSHSCT